jgi:GMP synthase-like glutamine amidotransferase
LSRHPRVIVVNNDDPDSDYGATCLAEAFEGSFDPEVVSPLGGLPRAERWIDGREAEAIVLSGSDRSLKEGLPWMLEEEALLRAAVGARVPVLAVCFGHQLLGEAFGASLVTREKRVGLFEVTLVGRDPAFDGLSGVAVVPEQHADQLSAVPDGFRLIATSDYCPIQAIRHNAAPVYGVQFHPCYTDSVFEADEEWGSLAELRGRFYHDGSVVLANVSRLFARLAEERGIGGTR